MLETCKGRRIASAMMAPILFAAIARAAVKTSYLLAAILALSIVGALVSSRALKTGALFGTAGLSLFMLLRMAGVF